MKRVFQSILISLLLLSTISVLGQNKGLKTITEKELRYHMDFLGAAEFRGRETPSAELEIATLYLGNWCKEAGLKPFLSSGSFYQTIPINVTKVSTANSRLRVITEKGEETYYYEESFGGNFYTSGSCYGEAVFVGLGIVNTEKGWDDLKDLDLFGKIVVLLDEQLPDNKFSLGFTYSYRLESRIRVIRDKGAAAVLYVANMDRENKKANGQVIFADIPSGRIPIQYDSQKRGTPSTPTKAAEGPLRPNLPFYQAEISHDVAASILGVPKGEIASMFESISKGIQVSSKAIPKTIVNLSIEVKTTPATTRNIIAMVEGSDPVLKNEYIVICAHHDHLGISDGEIIAGADDNATGTVALMEIAQALLTERPKQSVIVAWFTGEERGFIGSQYFVNNLPIPVENINTCLNMDMLGRNNSDSLFLIGSDLLSTELDASINKVNKQFGINLGFSYKYSNLTHPQRVYFRSDQYPHIRFGIPSVWFFCGFTHDYHTPKDILEFIDYKKMLKITKLVYLTAMDIGNKLKLLKLDVNPEVTSRGKHNLPTKSLYENVK